MALILIIMLLLVEKGKRPRHSKNRRERQGGEIRIPKGETSAVDVFRGKCPAVSPQI